MAEVVMPKLSESMEQGTILSWLKASGERIAIDDELLEIETDKATVTYAAEVAGVLEILVGEGSTATVGEPIARVDTDARKPDAHDPDTPKTARVPVTVAAVASASAPVDEPSGRGNGRERRAATPLARRVAAAHGVALDDIKGTGPLGRITRSDVLAHAGVPARIEVSPPTLRASAPAPLAPLAVQPAADPPGVKRHQQSRLQHLIAERMANAKATIPHFQVQTEVTMTATIALRAEIKALTAEHDPVPSLNDIIIKAAALALREHPLANGSYQDDGFVLLHDAINIGIAVAADGALVVPTVFDAADKSLGQIARETLRLAARVRSREISPVELEGATFTISNLGMLVMTAITPVINPPQAAILGVGAIRETLARVNDEIIDRPILTLTLSCDHRILYGADAARFLARIRQLLETPLELIL